MTNTPSQLSPLVISERLKYPFRQFLLVTPLGVADYVAISHANGLGSLTAILWMIVSIIASLALLAIGLWWVSTHLMLICKLAMAGAIACFAYAFVSTNPPESFRAEMISAMLIAVAVCTRVLHHRLKATP